jgi:hypothetical protein
LPGNHFSIGNIQQELSANHLVRKTAADFDKKSILQVKREAKKALRDKHFPLQAELQSMLASISPADLGDSPD